MELLDGVFLPVVSRTDAAISKLIWVDNGSQRSRRDFRSIFRKGTEIQQADIRAHAKSPKGYTPALVSRLQPADRKPNRLKGRPGDIHYSPGSDAGSISWIGGTLIG
jgi:hypothetical protein